jgi:hypothetical protein
VPHSIIAVGGANLDLYKRDKGKLADSYGKNIVNVGRELRESKNREHNIIYASLLLLSSSHIMALKIRILYNANVHSDSLPLQSLS